MQRRKKLTTSELAETLVDKEPKEFVFDDVNNPYYLDGGEYEPEDEEAEED